MYTLVRGIGVNKKDLKWMKEPECSCRDKMGIKINRRWNCLFADTNVYCWKK